MSTLKQPQLGQTILALRQEKKITQEELYQITNVFKNFDRDKDGTLSFSDLHMCLHSLGERTKAKKEKQLFAEYGESGKIPFAAFCEILADFRAASPKASNKGKHGFVTTYLVLVGRPPVLLSTASSSCFCKKYLLVWCSLSNCSGVFQHQSMLKLSLSQSTSTLC